MSRMIELALSIFGMGVGIFACFSLYRAVSMFIDDLGEVVCDTEKELDEIARTKTGKEG